MADMIRQVLLWLCLASSAVAQSTMTAPVGKFPSLNVQVTIGTQEQAERGSFYRKTMTILPKLTIEGTGRMLPIPAAQATMLIITMDTKAKFKDLKDVYKVFATETLPIPEARTGDRRQFSFAESSVTFDGYRDSSNVGGNMYKYYIFGLLDPETKTLIDFKTNNAPLLALCKAHPEKREEFLSMPKDAKMPVIK
jgi:hypothetical protein